MGEIEVDDGRESVRKRRARRGTTKAGRGLSASLRPYVDGENSSFVETSVNLDATDAPRPKWASDRMRPPRLCTERTGSCATQQRDRNPSPITIKGPTPLPKPHTCPRAKKHRNNTCIHHARLTASRRVNEGLPATPGPCQKNASNRSLTGQESGQGYREDAGDLA